MASTSEELDPDLIDPEDVDDEEQATRPLESFRSISDICDTLDELEERPRYNVKAIREFERDPVLNAKRIDWILSCAPDDEYGYWRPGRLTLRRCGCDAEFVLTLDDLSLTISHDGTVCYLNDEARPDGIDLFVARTCRALRTVHFDSWPKELFDDSTVTLPMLGVWMFISSIWQDREKTFLSK
jgi:hypothetical protein